MHAPCKSFDDRENQLLSLRLNKAWMYRIFFVTAWSQRCNMGCKIDL